MSEPSGSTPQATHTLSLLPSLGADENDDPQLYFEIKHASSSGELVSNRDLWRWVFKIGDGLKGLQMLQTTPPFIRRRPVDVSAVRANLKAEGTLDKDDSAVSWEICEDETTFNEPSRGDRISRMHGLTSPCSMVCLGDRPGPNGPIVGMTSSLCTPRSSARQLRSHMSGALKARITYRPGIDPSLVVCNSAVAVLAKVSTTQEDRVRMESNGSTEFEDINKVLWPGVETEVRWLNARHGELAGLSAEACDVATFTHLARFMALVKD